MKHIIDWFIKFLLSNDICWISSLFLGTFFFHNQISVLCNLFFFLDFLTKNLFSLSNSKKLVFAKFLHDVLHFHVGLFNPSFKDINIWLIHFIHCCFLFNFDMSLWFKILNRANIWCHHRFNFFNWTAHKFWCLKWCGLSSLSQLMLQFQVIGVAVNSLTCEFLQKLFSYPFSFYLRLCDFVSLLSLVFFNTNPRFWFNVVIQWTTKNESFVEKRLLSFLHRDFFFKVLQFMPGLLIKFTL